MKPPAFQFYPSDFLSDLNVIVMNGAEVGAYALLMSVCWLENGLPDDMEELATVSKMDVPTFTASWERRIRRCFRLREDGRWDHPRLQAERDKQERFREKMSEAGHRGGRGHKANASRGKGSAKGRLSPSKGEAFENKALLSSISNNNPLPPSGDVDAVLAHYVGLHPKRRIVGQKLRSLVGRALQSYSVAELIEALDGNARDSWHRERSKHELSYVLRDSEMIDSFRAKLLSPQPATLLPSGTRDRATRLYEAFKRHGFTRNLPMETHFATVAALSAAGKIQDGEQFIAELKAVSPWTWMGSTREIDKEKTISRIATAIAPLQPPKAA